MKPQRQREGVERGRGEVVARLGVGFHLRRPMIRLFLAGIAVALCGLLTPAGPSQADDLDRMRYHNRAFQVVDVVDGDTVDVGARDGRFPSTRVRLWGVDTPEVAGSRDGEMHFGREASAFTREALRGKSVRLQLSPDRTRDVYGRLLAYVVIEPGGACLNELLVETGYAYADGRFRHHYTSRYEGLERWAKKHRLGLWEGVTFEGMPGWRRRMEASR